VPIEDSVYTPLDHMATFEGLFEGGMEGLKRGYSDFFNAYPDLHATVNLLIAEGDIVVAYKTLKGTPRGTHIGVPATGNPVEFQIISIYRIRDCKISEYWGLQDEFGLKQQLGVFADDKSSESR
jgi:predicted ester cyclase